MNGWTIAISLGLVVLTGLITGALKARKDIARTNRNGGFVVYSHQCGGDTEDAKYHRTPLGQPRQLSRRRVLTRNGLSICVVDHREAYRERRAHVGYGQVVSDAEKIDANNVLIRHNHKKLQTANVAMMNYVLVSTEEINKLLMANQHNVVGRDPT